MATKRSIFEEVGSGAPAAAPAPRGGLIDGGRAGARGLVRGWLVLLFALVALMIVVGGLTRLTDSGLAITEWRPVTGALPPMSDADWAAEFARYQASPEGSSVNASLDLPGFQRLYWWEWGHRQLGRVIGLVWAAGFAGLALARRLPPGWAPRLLLLGGLGGLQGAIGWWMVRSGLTGDMVDVASYRLAVHLGLAFAILGLIAWFVLSLSRSQAEILAARRAGEPRLAALATGAMHLAFVQILLGALVAGIDAGRGYTDWPLMGGQILPPDPFSEVPLWRNLFENPALVQFLHRIAGYLLGLMAILLVLRGRASVLRETRGAFLVAGLMIGLQILLGIVTLLHGAPLPLAILHQIGAIATFVLLIRARHRARFPLRQSLR